MQQDSNLDPLIKSQLLQTGNRSQGNAVAEEADDIRVPAFDGVPPRASDPYPADGVRSGYVNNQDLGRFTLHN